jgi:oligopeptide transport system permease protein
MTPGLSPARAAMSALLRDPWAVAGAVVVTCIALACCLAPLLSPCGPGEQRLWIGAVAPGTTHVDAPARLELAVGQAVVLPRLPTGATALTLSERQRTSVDFRARLRRGVVEVQQATGAERVARLDLDAAPARILDEAGNPGDQRSGLLVSGQAPPAGFFPAGTSLLLLRQDGPTVHVAWQVAIADGRVTALSRDGVPATTADLDGATIAALAWTDAAGASHAMTLRHPLGTDHLGRDVLARCLHGGRISLLVGLVATLVSVLIGVAVGATAGYAGGRIDRLLMAGVDILYAVPFIFLVILLMVVVRGDGDRNETRELLLLFAALGAVQWLTMARIVRGTVLSIAARDFILAARASGLTAGRIVVRHVLPNCIGVVIVYATLTVPVVIMEESFLAFIGLGVSLGGVDSWGAQIELGNQRIDWSAGTAWWLLAVPAGAMVATLAGLSLLGDRLRAALDPRRP